MVFRVSEPGGDGVAKIGGTEWNGAADDAPGSPGRRGRHGRNLWAADVAAY